MRLSERVRELGRGLIGALAGAALLAAAPSFAEAPSAAPSAGAAPRATAAAAPRPAIWLLEDADTRIYLFGTTHMFERGLAWRSARLDAVVREADELVMETADDDEPDMTELVDAMFMRKSVPILSRVSEPHRAQLQRIVEESGLPPEMWDSLQTWAAAVVVMATQMMAEMTDEQRAEANPFEAMMSGAEIELSADFRRAGKPISAVESSAFQMNMLRTLPRPAQQAFLESTLQDAGRAAAEGAEGFDSSWVRGDVEAIAREMETMPPSLYEPMLTQRNRAWTEWLVRRLERPGTVLFAVGAGHLAGRDSVQSMLAARGLTARRID
jgi:hypothetical protein